MSLKSILISAFIALCLASLSFTPVLGVLAGKVMNFYPGVITRMNQCPKVEELLGKNARLNPIGINYGTASIEGSFGRVTWRFPVKGDLKSGSFKFYLEKDGSPWEMTGGLVTVGDRQLEVVICDWYEKPDLPQVM